MKHSTASMLSSVLAIVAGCYVNAAPLWHGVPYQLSYQQIEQGVSSGIGHVTIDPSVLTPDNAVFTGVPNTFVTSFSLTFSNVPIRGTISFDLSDLGAAFIRTGASGEIVDLNFWFYDRISVGTNTCPLCTEPYLAGLAPLIAAVTDPINGVAIVYEITATLAGEPAAHFQRNFGSKPPHTVILPWNEIPGRYERSWDYATAASTLALRPRVPSIRVCSSILQAIR